MTKKRGTTPHSSSTEKSLIENTIALQNVIVELAEKFDNLSVQISKLLKLFETSAKALAERDFNFENPSSQRDNKKIIDKLGKLEEQNKIIAKGLTLLHEPKEQFSDMEKEIPYLPENPPRPGQIPIRQNPYPPAQRQTKMGMPQSSANPNMNQYQKSINSKPKNPKSIP